MSAKTTSTVSQFPVGPHKTARQPRTGVDPKPVLGVKYELAKRICTWCGYTFHHVHVNGKTHVDYVAVVAPVGFDWDRKPSKTPSALLFGTRYGANCAVRCHVVGGVIPGTEIGKTPAPSAKPKTGAGRKPKTGAPANTTTTEPDTTTTTTTEPVSA
jgi:hypothetical protein